MQVLLDDTPLHSGHAGRGIGTYTRQLLRSLEQLHLVKIAAGSWKTADKEVSLIHFPYFDLFAPTLPKLRKPFVVTVHDVIPLQFPSEYPVGVRGKLALWRQTKALRSARLVITDSQASKTAIHSFLSVPLSNIIVIPLAADPELLPAQESDVEKVQKRYDLPKQYTLYVGDINYNKNLPQLIKSLKYLDDSIHLVLVGHNFREQDIPEWHAIERQLALSDVTKRVHFLPDIKTGTTKTLSALYAGSLCYVQPSLAEGFGLPVLEALQVGTPVVASNRTSLPEVGGSVVHYCEPDAQSFALAVEEIVSYPAEKREKLIKAGQRHAATFSWENTARLTAEVYQRILTKSR